MFIFPCTDVYNTVGTNTSHAGACYCWSAAQGCTGRDLFSLKAVRKTAVQLLLRFLDTRGGATT